MRKIVSGAQTGADRAALDVAIELGIEHGGWVPAGRWAEDGPVASCYRVTETASHRVEVRTRRNIRDADATLLLSHGPLSGGSALTATLAQRYAKPLLHIDLLQLSERQAVEQIRSWLLAVGPEVLNVAGPRQSNDPLIYDAVARVLRGVLAAR